MWFKYDHETRGRRALLHLHRIRLLALTMLSLTLMGNRPYQPIGFDVAPGLDGFDYLTPDGTRKHIAFSELVAEDEKPDAASCCVAVWLHFRSISPPLCREAGCTGKDRKAADRWLVNTFERHVLTQIDSVNSVYQPDTMMPGILLPIRDQLFPYALGREEELKNWLIRLPISLRASLPRVRMVARTGI